MKWRILLNMTSLLITTTALHHFNLSLDETLALVLRKRQRSVHDQECHHTAVTPEGPVEAHQVKEERVEFDGSKHVDGRAGTTNTRGIGSASVLLEKKIFQSFSFTLFQWGKTPPV